MTLSLLLPALLIQETPATDSGPVTLRIVAAALALILVVIVILRRKRASKKEEEDEF